MSHALQIRALRKSFGSFTVLDGLELAVPEGGVLGFVGPNGAGKTTTFSIVAGYLRPDDGIIELFGGGRFDVRRHRGRLGILPQDAYLPGTHIPETILTHYARLQGLRGPALSQAVRQALDIAGLAEREREVAGKLSHGMRRRLQIGQAFLGTPDLVLLDEPTNGLDPVQARRVRQFISSQRGERSVVVSSHNLAELESICTHIVQIDRGRTLAQSSVEDLRRRQRMVRIWLHKEPTPEAKAALGQAVGERSQTWNDEHRVEIDLNETDLPEEIATLSVRALIDSGCLLAEVATRCSLEEALLGEG